MISFEYNPEIERLVFETKMAPTKEPDQLEQFREQILDILPDPESRFMREQVSYITKSWGIVASHFYDTLGKFYEKDIKEPQMSCYLVRTDIYPYEYDKGDESWFAAPLFTNHLHRNAKIRHELCHYFQPVPLPRAIKEAIPSILNDESFQQHWPDRGNQEEEEQYWRQIILELYQKGQTFSDLVALLKEKSVIGE